MLMLNLFFHLQSSNGTFVNHEEITIEERELRENDVIGLGIQSLTPGLYIKSRDSTVDPMEPYFEFRFLKVSVSSNKLN